MLCVVYVCWIWKNVGIEYWGENEANSHLFSLVNEQLINQNLKLKVSSMCSMIHFHLSLEGILKKFIRKKTDCSRQKSAINCGCTYMLFARPPRSSSSLWRLLQNQDIRFLYLNLKHKYLKGAKLCRDCQDYFSNPVWFVHFDFAFCLRVTII